MLRPCLTSSIGAGDSKILYVSYFWCNPLEESEHGDEREREKIVLMIVSKLKNRRVFGQVKYTVPTQWRSQGGDFKRVHDSIKPPVWSRRFVAKFV